MWIAETIDLDDHDSVVRFMKKQSDKIKELEKENEQLKSKLFDVKLELEHSKESNDDAHYELTQIKKENDDLKRCILKDIFADECEEYKKENEQLKKELASFKPVIFESDGKPVTLYKKGDVE